MRHCKAIYSDIPLYVATLDFGLFGGGSISLCLVITKYNTFQTTHKDHMFCSLRWIPDTFSWFLLKDLNMFSNFPVCFIASVCIARITS